MAAPTITCRASCAGSRRTSAFTTSITYAVEFPAIGCQMYCGIIRSSLSSDELPCSRVCSAHRSLCGMKRGGVSFHLERRRSYVDHPCRLRAFVSKIICDQVIRTPASANIHLGSSGAYQVTVGIERVQKARLIEAGIWLNTPQRGFVDEEGCLHRAIVSPEPYSMPCSVV